MSLYDRIVERVAGTRAGAWVSMRVATREKLALARATSMGRAKAPSTAAELERLTALHDRAAITDDEYAAAKRELLAR